MDEHRLAGFFHGGYSRADFPNEQSFDCAGLEGRLLSSSYAPGPGHARHMPMLATLKDLFERYNDGGRARFSYQTEVYAGKLGA